LAEGSTEIVRSPVVRTAAETAETKRGFVEALPHLRLFARSLTRNSTEADDLVQETLLKALANIDRFEPGTRLRPWLFTIMRNTFYSDCRKKRFEVRDVDGEHAARLVQGPGQDGAVDFGNFKAAFARLQADHREVLILIGVSGCSYEEAAAVCGCAVGTIKSRVNRARRRLEELVGDDSGAGEKQYVDQAAQEALVDRW
jgi:RNA polymerase sigma-70 factor (ECF subfamily)